jgi:hypothetical protein
MFEIYRDTLYQGDYRVVYFTELDDHDKEKEISRAMAGEHVFDGFLDRERRAAGKQTIAEILDALNGGAALSRADIERALDPFIAS